MCKDIPEIRSEKEEHSNTVEECAETTVSSVKESGDKHSCDGPLILPSTGADRSVEKTEEVFYDAAEISDRSHSFEEIAAVESAINEDTASDVQKQFDKSDEMLVNRPNLDTAQELESANTTNTNKTMNAQILESPLLSETLDDTGRT